MTISNGGFETQDPASGNSGVADDWSVTETYTGEEYAEFTTNATAPAATLGQETFESEWPAGYTEGVVEFTAYFDDLDPAFFDFSGSPTPTSYEDFENLWGTGTQGPIDFESSIPTTAIFDSAEPTGSEFFEDFEQGWPAAAVFLENLAAAGSQAASFTFAGPESFETSWTGQPYNLAYEASELAPALFQYSPSAAQNREEFEANEFDFVVTIVAPGTDTFTAVGHGLDDNWKITFYNEGGRLPEGLFSDTIYVVQNKTADTWQVAAVNGGSIIDVTDVGFGTHYVKHDPAAFWTEELDL
jgi:hypothetical protein